MLARIPTQRNVSKVWSEILLKLKAYRASLVLTSGIILVDFLLHNPVFTLFTALSAGSAIVYKPSRKKKRQVPTWVLSMVGLGTSLLLSSSPVMAQTTGTGNGIFGNLPQIFSNAIGNTGGGTVILIFAVLEGTLAAVAIFTFFQGLGQARNGSDFASAMTPFFLTLLFAVGCPLIITLYTGNATGK